MGFRKQGPDLSAEPPAPAAAEPLFGGVTLGGRIIGAPMADKIVARLIKQACQEAGVDPTQFSGHSLRRGPPTTRARCSCRSSMSCDRPATSRSRPHSDTSRAAMPHNYIMEPVFGRTPSE
jgi:hypothetical protein